MIAKEANFQVAADLLVLTLEKTQQPDPVRVDFETMVAEFAAQKTMADCLRGELSEVPDLLVFNCLALGHGQGTIRIDQLVLSRRAAYLIDSRALAEPVEVDREQNWFRLHGQRRIPMKSPVDSLDRRMATLVGYMQTHIRDIAPESAPLAMRELFDRSYTRKCYLSIASGAELHGWKHKSFTELIRSHDEVAKTIGEHHRSTRVSPLMKLFRKATPEQTNVFTDEQLARWKQLILEHDEPADPIRIAAETVINRCQPLPASLEQAIRDIEDEAVWNPQSETLARDRMAVLQFCRQCGSDHIRLEKDPSGYHFECRDCQGWGPVQAKCFECGAQAKVVLTRHTAFARCSSCGRERVFFVNR